MEQPCVKKWLQDNINKYVEKEDLINACIETLGVKRKSVTNKINEIWNDCNCKEHVGFISKDEFIDQIDKVKQTIEYLDKNVGDNYIDTNKLRISIDVSTTRWQQMVKLPVIAERMFIYQNAANQRITVFSSKKGVELAKTTISMSRYDQ